jgi:hypothetical protein
MLKSILIISSVFLLFSCGGNTENSSSAVENKQESTSEKYAELDKGKAEDWLVKALEKFFEEEQSYSIFTREYVDYKADATAVGYDDGLTEEEFNTKWSSKFNTKYAGLGNGFLISAQDWSKIIVTNCEFKKQKDSVLYFDVILTDKDFKEDYKREIHVIEKNGNFLISDVLEY